MVACLAGCKPDPCPVAEDMVEASRGAASEAQRGVDETASRKQELESQIESKQAQIRDLEQQKTQIEAELAELLGT